MEKGMTDLVRNSNGADFVSSWTILAVQKKKKTEHIVSDSRNLVAFLVDFRSWCSWFCFVLIFDVMKKRIKIGPI